MIFRPGSLCAALVALACYHSGPAEAAGISCALDRAVFSENGKQLDSFDIELATTVKERERGLMYRESMPEDAGMLFVYPDEGPRSFWMRNTLIPLDMIFIDAAGMVVSVHENAIPGDLTPISSGADARFVLELNGGRARADGISRGTVLSHPMIARQVALRPCSD
ncbi:DUF192 domain-containing protein [Thioclava sp. GXIMD2076]|uniref:DUF192 domain-containing protein n=1 Tax=Thioclava sp. GXIMD2076 TaxID=3131931 RepID=UPI0030D2E089